MLVQSTSFWYSRIPEILSTPFNSVDFNFSSDHSDPFFLLLNLGSIQSFAIYCSTSYFWCVISRSRSRGGRMITSYNWISTSFSVLLLGASGSHLMSSSLGASHHLGHLITRGIVSPSFRHLCHLLHLMISWSNIITFLVRVRWTGIGIV